MSSAIEAKLQELGVTIPTPAASVANYVGYVTTGSLVFVSGQLPLEDGKVAVSGHLGKNVSIEDGYKGARICAINLLAQLKAATNGDLGRIKRVVRLTGFISSTPDFTEQSKIINGASDFLVEVLGDAGRHARISISVAALPMGAAVEVEGVFEIA